MKVVSLIFYMFFPREPPGLVDRKNRPRRGGQNKKKWCLSAESH